MVVRKLLVQGQEPLSFIAASFLSPSAFLENGIDLPWALVLSIVKPHGLLKISSNLRLAASDLAL